MAFVQRTWERRHAEGLRERIIQTTDAWCEGFIVDRGSKERAGRGTSRDIPGLSCGGTWHSAATSAPQPVTWIGVSFLTGLIEPAYALRVTTPLSPW